MLLLLSCYICWCWCDQTNPESIYKYGSIRGGLGLWLLVPQQFQQLYREMVNCVTYHVTFTILSLQASTILVSGESLVNILDNIANNLQDYG